MEIGYVIGMLAAFFAGAYVCRTLEKGLRKNGEPEKRETGAVLQSPDSRASAEAAEERRKREEDRIAQLQNMLNYIGRGQGRED